MPDRLPQKPRWRKLMPSPGLGGLAATEEVVIASGRDLNDTVDLWRCIDAGTGETKWSLRYEAAGKLDYGPTPRATPLIHDGMVYCYGAFGHLHAVDVTNGKIKWKRDSQADFGTPIKNLPWGLCGSPLIVDNKLIYYPGGPQAALVALDCKTGEVIWKTPGSKPAYGSFVAATLGGIQQVVGYDHDSLGGWETNTGKRLWTLKPEQPRDFNVPTPIVHNGQLIVTTENNGTRIYRFDSNGKIDPKPVAINEDLHPDTHSPVLVGELLFGVHRGLFCLDVSKGLQTRWSSDDDLFIPYAAAVASDKRVLIINLDTEAVILEATGEQFRELDRRKLLPDERDMYTHPAFAGGKMFLRSSEAVVCFELANPNH